MTTEYYPPFPLGHKGPEGSKGPGRSATGHLNNIPAPKYAYIYQRGFYIIWKANFVGRITVEVVFYLNYPTLWKSITVEVVLYLNYPTLRKMLAKSAANFAKKSQKFVKIFRSDKSKIANGM